MKIFIYYFFILILCILSLSCKDNQQTIVTPKAEIRNYLFSSGNGVLKENGIQPYILYSEDNDPIESDINQAPDSIIDSSKTYIYNLLGEAYYHSHMKYRSSVKIDKGWYTYDIGGKYVVSHYYNIIIKDFITHLVVATYHDSLGRVLANEGVLPRLKDTTLGMPFKIDDFNAVRIAMTDGFESGYFPWHVMFKYDESNKCYVWNIINQTSSESGKGINIDTQTGNIIRRMNWRIFFDKKLNRRTI